MRQGRCEEVHFHVVKKASNWLVLAFPIGTSCLLPSTLKCTHSDFSLFLMSVFSILPFRHSAFLPDGDEVVLHAFKQKSPLLKPPPGQTWKDFMPEALAPLHSDSTLLNTLHEWRFNLRDGSVRERQLAGADFLCDFPRINEKYTGRRYR